MWHPPTTDIGFGEFSIKTEQGSSVVDFETIFENIDLLAKSKKFHFLIILDEFQEIANIKGAAARLRNNLQKLHSTIPVIILGSKYHMLTRIFDEPKAPFYSWGNTIELKNIPYEDYFDYMRSRFLKADKKIGFDISRYIQDTFDRIPESINRFCDFLTSSSESDFCEKKLIDIKLMEFVDMSGSIYAEHYASFNQKERSVLKALAANHKTKSILNVSFLKKTDNVSKSGVQQIIKRFLDRSVIYRLHDSEDEDFYYLIADPIFRHYITVHKIMAIP